MKKLFNVLIFLLVASYCCADSVKEQTIYARSYGDLSYSTLTNVIGKVGSTDTIIDLTGGYWPITDDYTVTTNVFFRIPPSCGFNISTGKTVTLNCGIDAGAYDIFNGLGLARGSAEFMYRYPEWGDTTQYNIGNGSINSDWLWNIITNASYTMASGTTVNFDNLTANSITSGTLNVTSDLTVGGNASIASNLTVGGNASIASNLTVDGNETIGGTLAVTGDVTMANVNITGTVQGENLTNLVETVVNTSTNITLTPVATVISSMATNTPSGYIYCDGSAVSRTTYANLFTAIGISCGQGDGSTTFNVPDFRGRFLRGQDDSASLDPDASGRTAMATGGNTGDNVGSVQDDQLASHTHTVVAVGGGTNVHPSSPVEASSSDDENVTTLATGGNETRPVNAYVRYYIKY